MQVAFAESEREGELGVDDDTTPPPTQAPLTLGIPNSSFHALNPARPLPHSLFDNLDFLAMFFRCCARSSVIAYQHAVWFRLPNNINT